MVSEGAACVVCGAQRFDVVLEHLGRVMTSDRRVLRGSLRKELCWECGALRSCTPDDVPDWGRFYREDYQQNVTAHKFSYVTPEGVVPRSAVEWTAVRRLRAPRAGERWLEIGAGSGDVMSHLRAEAPDTLVQGVELSESAASVGRQRGLDITPGGLDAARGTFDVIYAIGVIEHVPDPRSFIDRAVSLLRPGGSLILGLPDRDTLTFDCWFVDHLHHFSVGHVQRLCGDAGLSRFVDGWRPDETPHFMYVLADATGLSPVRGTPTISPPALQFWRTALARVREVFAQTARVGFLGASETAAFFLTYALDDGDPMPILFDDTVSEPTHRYGCQVRPGLELDAGTATVDVVVVATVPAYYARLRTDRIARCRVPVVFPLEVEAGVGAQ